MFGFFDHRDLEFDEACLRSMAVARRFAGHNQRQEITAADLMRGLLHATSPESVSFLRTLQFGYGDEVEAVSKIAKQERDNLGKGLGLSGSVKKVLARANQRACSEKRDKVVFADLVWGIAIERPRDVAADLAQVGRTWEEIERYADAR